MKLINATELKIGDIFANEIKISHRESFEVIELSNEFAICNSRNDFSSQKKRIKKRLVGKVYHLR